MASIDATGKGRDRHYRVRYRTPSGESRSRTFKLRGHADTFASTVETDKSRGAFADPARARIRFVAWEKRWRDAPRPGRASSRARDESYLRSLVVPHFGQYRLSDVTRAEVQGWVDMLASEPRNGTGKPLAPASVHKAHQVLAKVLEAAVIDERLATNPTRGVALPRVEDTEARFLSPDELLALEEAMPEQWRLLVPFLADTALRIGEAAGLQWSDVDTWAGIVHVRQVLVEVHGQITLGPPKTAAGRRTVPTLTREVGERLETGRGHPDGYVFAAPGGGPLRPNNFRARAWRPAVAVAGLAEPPPTPHALRHSAVAHWIAAGIEPYKLAKWAGHRSVSTIYRVYGHLLDTDATEEREALSAIRAAATAKRAERGQVVNLAR
jgi:integrase